MKIFFRSSGIVNIIRSFSNIYLLPIIPKDRSSGLGLILFVSLQDEELSPSRDETVKHHPFCFS